MAPVFATSAPAANEARAVDDNVLVQYYFDPSDTTDVLYPGMVLCMDPSFSMVADRILKVRKPDITNAHLCVGVVAPQSARTPAGAFVKVVPLDRLIPGVPVRTDQNISINDLLGCHPGSYYARKGTCKSIILGRAVEAQDRSSTAGTVTCEFGKIVYTSAEYARFTKRVFDDFESFGTTLVSGSPYGIQQVNGSVTIPAGSASASKSGVVRLTATGADNDQCFLYGGKVFKLEIGKPLYAEFRVDLGSSVSTPDLIFGLITTDIIAAAVPITAGDALAANNTTGMSMVAVYKLTGGTTLSAVVNRQAATANQATQALSGSAATIAASTSRKIALFYDGIAGTTNTGGTLYILIDDVVNSATIGLTAAQLPTFNMGIFCGVKSQGSAETFDLDSWFAEQPF